MVIFAKREDKESEPESWAFHEEPGQRWRDGGAPALTVVFAIWGSEELAGYESGWAHDEESEERGVEKGLIGKLH